MCSRYSIGENVRRWLARYGWKQPLSKGDVRPQDCTPVLSAHGKSFSIVPMRWGMKNPKTGALVINAREETAAAKPMFSASLAHCRCILPAERFYEWDAGKQKVTFQPPAGGLLYLCGLYRLDENIPHFVILTKPANEVMQPVHDRMPVMVREEDIDAWLSDSSRTKDLLESEVPLERIQAVEELSLFS